MWLFIEPFILNKQFFHIGLVYIMSCNPESLGVKRETMHRQQPETKIMCSDHMSYSFYSYVLFHIFHIVLLYLYFSLQRLKRTSVGAVGGMTVLFRPLPLLPARVLSAVCVHVRSEAPHHPLLDEPAHTRLAHASSASFVQEAFDRSL